MTIDERIEAINKFTDDHQGGSWRSTLDEVKRQMESAVAEAVASLQPTSEKTTAEEAKTVVETWDYGGYLDVAQKDIDAITAKRVIADRVDRASMLKAADERNDRQFTIIQELRERHAAEMAQKESQLKAVEKEVINKCDLLAQERANWQAQMKRLEADLAQSRIQVKRQYDRLRSKDKHATEAMATAYEEAAKAIDKEISEWKQVLPKQQVAISALRYAADEVRQLAAKPQEPESVDCQIVSDLHPEMCVYAKHEVGSPTQCPHCNAIDEAKKRLAKPQEAGPTVEEATLAHFGIKKTQARSPKASDDSPAGPEQDHKCPTYPECECGLTQAHDAPPAIRPFRFVVGQF